MQLDSLLHVLALAGFAHVLIVNPAQAVAGDLVAVFDKGADHVRVALHGHADAKYGQRQAALAKLAQDAPGTGARAVFVE